MLTTKDFESLIERPETSVLDFKASMYDFENDLDLRKTASFIKDVISFANTVRNETSYIVIGIEEQGNGRKVFNGLTKTIDDAILQDKVKDKVYPRPIFKYYSLEYKNKIYGILEFPVVKYPLPLSPTIKMKGLEIGKVYFRHGTANTEALGMQVITINNWLQSLPDHIHDNNLTDEIGRLVKTITDTETKLSIAIAEVYKIAKKYQLQDLIKFCAGELQGVPTSKNDGNADEFEYRIRNIIITPLEIEINPYMHPTQSQLKTELKNMEGVYEYRLKFSQSISTLESIANGFHVNPNSIATMKLPPNSFGLQGNLTVYAYIFPDDFISLFGAIRQKAIDKLLSI